jgi:hypothetical protein
MNTASFVAEQNEDAKPRTPTMVESASASRKRQNQQNQQDESTNTTPFLAEQHRGRETLNPYDGGERERELKQEATKSARIARGTDNHGCRSSRRTESSARTCGSTRRRKARTRTHAEGRRGEERRGGGEGMIAAHLSSAAAALLLPLLAGEERRGEPKVVARVQRCMRCGSRYTAVLASLAPLARPKAVRSLTWQIGPLRTGPGPGFSGTSRPIRAGGPRACGHDASA